MACDGFVTFGKSLNLVYDEHDIKARGVPILNFFEGSPQSLSIVMRMRRGKGKTFGFGHGCEMKIYNF